MEATSHPLTPEGFKNTLKLWAKSPDKLISASNTGKVQFNEHLWSYEGQDDSIESFFETFIKDHQSLIDHEHIPKLLKISQNTEPLKKTRIINEIALKIFFPPSLENESVNSFLKKCTEGNSPLTSLQELKLSAENHDNFALSLAKENPILLLTCMPLLKINNETKNTLASFFACYDWQAGWKNYVNTLYKQFYQDSKPLTNQIRILKEKLAFFKEIDNQFCLKNLLIHFKTDVNSSVLIKNFAQNFPERVWDEKEKLPLLELENQAGLCFIGMLKKRPETIQEFHEFNILDSISILTCMKKAFKVDPIKTLALLKTFKIPHTISKSDFLTFELSFSHKNHLKSLLGILQQLQTEKKTPWKDEKFSEEELKGLGIDIQSLASQLLNQSSLASSQVILICKALTDPSVFLLSALEKMSSFPSDLIPELESLKLPNKLLFLIALRATKECPEQVLPHLNVFSSLKEQTQAQIMMFALIEIINKLHTSNQEQHQISLKFFTNLVQELKKIKEENLPPEYNDIINTLENIFTKHFESQISTSAEDFTNTLIKKLPDLFEQAKLLVPSKNYIEAESIKAKSLFTFLNWTIYTALAAKIYRISPSFNFDVCMAHLDIIHFIDLRHDVTDIFLQYLSPTLHPSNQIEINESQLNDILPKDLSSGDHKKRNTLLKVLLKLLEIKLTSEELINQITMSEISQLLITWNSHQDNEVKIIDQKLSFLEKKEAELKEGDHSEKIIESETKKKLVDLKKLKKELESLKKTTTEQKSYLQIFQSNFSTTDKKVELIKWLGKQLESEIGNNIAKRGLLSQFRFYNIFLEILSYTYTRFDLNVNEKLHFMYLLLTILQNPDQEQRKSDMLILQFIKLDTKILEIENCKFLEVHLKEILERKLHELNITCDNISKSFTESFGASREPTALFTYLTSLQKTFKFEKAKDNLALFIKDVFNETFKSERYNIKNSSHLEACTHFNKTIISSWQNTATELKMDVLLKEHHIPEYLSVCVCDDPIEIFLAGAAVNNCLSISSGTSNQHLLAQLINGKYQMIQVRDEKGTVGMAMVKLMLEENKPVLLVEQMYSKDHSKDKWIGNLIEAQCLQRAKELGVPICFEKNFFKEAYGSIERRGPFISSIEFEVKKISLEALLDRINTEYVDSLGGERKLPYTISKEMVYVDFKNLENFKTFKK